MSVIIVGLDLGTKFPARATLNLSDRKPRLVGSSRGNFTKLPPKDRPEAAFEWLKHELELAWTSDIRTIAVEDPTLVLQGVMRNQETNAHSLQWLMAQYHRITERARAMGFTVVTVQPRTVASRLGLKLTRGASVGQRRKEKKDQTRKWCSVIVEGGAGLSEDEADATSIAFVGAGKIRTQSIQNSDRVTNQRSER